MPLYLRERRQRAGLTIVNVAHSAGVNHSSYIAWEQGRAWPTADKLPKLAAALACSIDALYAPYVPPEGGVALPSTSIPDEGGRHNGA